MLIAYTGPIAMSSRMAAMLIDTLSAWRSVTSPSNVSE